MKLHMNLIFVLAVAWSCSKKAETDPNASTTDTKESKDNSDPGEKDGEPTGLSLKFSAKGISSILEGANLTGINLTGAEDETYGYPGIGMNYGESIVEGLKITLVNIQLQALKDAGSSATGEATTLVDFGEAGKELEIADGFKGSIDVTDNVTLDDGTYDQVGVQLKQNFSVKAYAYLDRDNDGTIDATVWTTASEVKMDTQKLAPGSMPNYDYFTYKWVVTTMAKNATDNSAFTFNNATILTQPIVIKEGKIVSTDAEGVETTSTELALDMLIDTFRAIKVWDGRYGNASNWIPGSGNPGQLPMPVFPFPQSSEDSRTLGSSGLKSYDFYPEGSPAFAFGNYLSIFSMINSTGLKAQNYLISKTQTITPYNTQPMTLILDGEGNPLFSRNGLGESNETLHLGPHARDFKKQSDSSFNLEIAAEMVASTANSAQFYLEGFRKLAVGQRGQMTLKDGPTCAGEHDYCVNNAAGVTAYYLRAQ